MQKLSITTSPLDTNQVGTFDIAVFFEEEGRMSEGIIHLTIVDNEAPTLTISDITIEEGSVFNQLADSTAEDNVDGDLTNAIRVSGTVDTTTPGTYELVYTVVDSSQNETTKTRKVTVQEDQQEHVETKGTAPVSNQTSVTNVVETTQQANTLQINNICISYQNGGQVSGQSIIDANPNGSVSTWGGAAIQSGEDGKNTHFIGHNPGIFSALLNLSIGQTISVTDSAGKATNYAITAIKEVDDSGIEVGTGIDYWNQIVGTGGGERITLQTCLSETENLIVFASK